MTEAIETEVVVVGAGPIGAAMAAELGRRGVKCKVIEMTNGVFKDPRLHAVTIRTMELMRKWGITDEMRNCGWPLDHPQDASYLTSLVGYEVARIPWASIREMQPPPVSPTFSQRCPQAWFNPILHRYANSFGSVEFLWEHKYLGLTQDESGVNVEIEPVNGGSPFVIRCKYVVACDGARSAVREHLGIEVRASGVYGYAAEAIVRSADIAAITRPRLAGRYTSVTDNGVSVTMLPYDGIDRFRIVLFAEPTGVDKTRMDAALRGIIGREVEYEYLTDVLPWVNRERVVEKFRKGRVFLAGDAAHTTPPAGGHGMNTGILDALDLGWKLAGVLDGWAGDALLDSYEYERKIGAARTIAMAGELYGEWHKVKPLIDKDLPYLTDESAEGDAARKRVGDLIVEVFSKEYDAYGVSLGYRYNHSPVIVDDGTVEPKDDYVEFIQTARPGHRVPHVWMADGRSTLDLVADVYTIIEVGSGTITAQLKAEADRRGIPVVVQRIEEPEVAEAFDSSALIARPDQFVAWRYRGEPVDVAGIWTTLSARSA